MRKDSGTIVGDVRSTFVQSFMRLCLASMIAMVVIGCVLFPLIGPWEFKFTKFPVVPWRYVKNRSVVGASLIGFFDFVRSPWFPGSNKLTLN